VVGGLANKICHKIWERACPNCITSAVRRKASLDSLGRENTRKSTMGFKSFGAPHFKPLAEISSIPFQHPAGGD
jgi:hypothetical protein